MSLRCFIQEQEPIPGTAAHPVSYPVCEWVGHGGEVDLHHPLNRFVCAWLTSDVNTIERCQEVLAAIAQIEAGKRAQWFVDGDAFCVNFSSSGVQFNFSHVGPDDASFWNLAAAKFDLSFLRKIYLVWFKFVLKNS